MPSFAKFDIWQNNAGVTRQTPLQVVQSTLTSQFETSATTVDFNWSVTITPSSSSNRILISMHSFSFLTRTHSDVCKMWLERSIGGGGFTRIQSPANYLGQGAVSSGGQGSEETYPNMMFLDSPATTLAVTYKITGQKNGSSGNNVAWNHNNTDPGDSIKKATLIAMEISQ